MATFSKHSTFFTSLAQKEAKGLVDTSERILYAASKNKGTVVKAAAGAVAFSKGLETDSWVLKGAGLCLMGSALLDAKKVKDDFNSFDLDKALLEMKKEEEFNKKQDQEFEEMMKDFEQIEEVEVVSEQ